MPANLTESLFEWYFRLNGYFLVPNFTIHKDFKKQPGGSDADILAVRYRYSREEPRNYCFERDGRLKPPAHTDFLIAEIKSGLCELNSAWTNRDYHNVEYALRWMGFTVDGEIDKIADAVYESGIWIADKEEYCVRVVLCGKYRNPDVETERPRVLQIEIDEALEFVRRRFTTGCNQKNRSNWDQSIQHIAKLCEQSRNIQELKALVSHEEIQASDL